MWNAVQRLRGRCFKFSHSWTHDLVSPMGARAEGDKARQGRDLGASHKAVIPTSWALRSSRGPSASVSPWRHKRGHSCKLYRSWWRNLTNKMDIDKLRTKKAIQTVNTPEGRNQRRWNELQPWGLFPPQSEMQQQIFDRDRIKWVSLG